MQAQNPQPNVPNGPTILNLPLPGGKQAPPKFTGDASQVEDFLDAYERLLTYYNITSPRDRCRSVLRYVSRRVREVIEALDTYQTSDWTGLKADIEELYDAELYKTRYKKKDLVAYVNRTRKRKMNTLAKWRKYSRNFVRIAGWLRSKEMITANEEKSYFWVGIGRRLRHLIEDRFLARHADHDRRNPYPMDEIKNIAESLLQRGRFEEAYLPSDDEDLETDWSGESESDSEASEDEDDDDVEVIETTRRKGKRVTKTRHVKHRSQKLGGYDSDREDRFDKAEALNRKNKLETPRARFKRTEQDDVADMIKKLSNMSISGTVHLDPRYAQLYYTAIKIDPDVAKVVPSPESLSVRAQSSQQPPQNLPPRPTQQPRMNASTSAPPLRPAMGRPPMQPGTCYGCGMSGHNLSSCGKLSVELKEGLLAKDPRGRITHGNGAAIVRSNGEPILQAAERDRGNGIGGRAGVVAAAYAARHRRGFTDTRDQYEDGNNVEWEGNHVPRKRYTYDRDGDVAANYLVTVEEAEEESENDVYHVRVNPEYEEDESEYEVYAVDKPAKVSKTARKLVFDGVLMPPRNARLNKREPHLDARSKEKENRNINEPARAGYACTVVLRTQAPRPLGARRDSVRWE